LKILELRFKNLNSLYGEWFIDFRDPEYVSNGIFALTGPTGAGKSTILDALCLALYGSTPRLGKITKSSNEIMSRQTGECFAEVLFETSSGLYRCHWSQHRGRKKAEGDLQAPRHEIAEGDGEGKVIENQLSRTVKEIQEKTGMDFDQFSRSILLAQGGFDTFLKADAEQKSRILEQITGTALYTEISKAVHEKLREEKEALALLTAESSGIMILETGQVEALEQEITGLRSRESEAALRKKAADEALLWLKGIEALREEISSMEEEQRRMEEELAAFTPERTRLIRSLKSAELEAVYTSLSSLRNLQKEDRAKLHESGLKLEQLTLDSARRKESYEKAAAETLRIKAEIADTAPLHHKVRSLDQGLNLKKETLLKGEEEYRKAAAGIDRDRQYRAAEQAEKERTEKELNSHLSYLQDHSADESLAFSLGVIEDQSERLQSLSSELAERQISLKSASERTLIIREKLKLNSGNLILCTENLQGIRDKQEKVRQESENLLAGRPLSDYRSEKETLQEEHAFRLRIAGMKGERDKLTDGHPCPLCGSEDHPYALGNIPLPDGTEVRISHIARIISRAEELEKIQKILDASEKSALQELGEAEKRETEGQAELHAAEAALQDLTLSLEKEREKLTALSSVLQERLSPIGITELPGHLPSLIQDLRSRLAAWKDRSAQKDHTEKQILRLDGEIRRLDALIEAGMKSMEERRKALDSLENEIHSEQEQRRTLYGDRNPDTEESRLNLDLKNAEELSETMRDAHQTCERELFSIRNLRSDLESRIAGRMTDLEKAESHFPEHLGSAGFEDEEDFLRARISSGEKEQLQSRAATLDEKQSELKNRLKDRKDRLQKELDKQLTGSDLKTLEEECSDLQDSLDSFRDALAGLKHRLEENAAAGERLKEKLQSIEARKKECLSWEKLHRLIGSADGKKYRNFAQGLTFELMVSHANRQLKKMTDRYLLLRDLSEPLELNVMDNYQAGEIRSTKNLSGGESFIISLSLALGLSGMASRKVRVDSLFLDEGFGTLDEDALETALETLSSLQREGKLIGIISHVPALKERIGTQISIIPLSGGKSVLSGPGCRRVEGC